jgi:hypothetical protein
MMVGSIVRYVFSPYRRNLLLQESNPPLVKRTSSFIPKSRRAFVNTVCSNLHQDVAQTAVTFQKAFQTSNFAI